MTRRRDDLRDLSRRAPPCACVAVALVVTGCIGDRPPPIDAEASWIQRSTDHVIFEQTAFTPESLSPASAEVRLVYAGPAAPPSAPVVDVEPGGTLELTARVEAQLSGWVLSVGVETAGLEPGTRTGTVRVAWEGAVNSPAAVNVTLVVRPHPGQWQPGQPPVANRYKHTTTALVDGGAVAIGGVYAEHGVERLDPRTGGWSPAGALEHGRFAHTATLLDSGEVFVAGGMNSEGSPDPSGTWEIWSPETETVIAYGILAEPRYDHTAVRLRDGRVMLVGGVYRVGSAPNAVELFDPWTRRSVPLGPVPHEVPQVPSAALLEDGRVLVTTAAWGTMLFDPSTGVWTAVASRVYRRTNHALVALADGRALVLGGHAEGPRANSLTAEVYDPARDAWTPTASTALWHGAVRDVAVRLPSGRVLVAGGEGLSAVELFDPAAGTWSVVGALATARTYHTVTLLGDGRLVAVGGLSYPPRPEFWREPAP
jgi:hypothetical protein